MTQRAAGSPFGIGIELVAMRKQPVRIGSAQSEEEARVTVAVIARDLQAGRETREPHDGKVVVLNPQRTYSVFAWSIDQVTGKPNETIVETRIRPHGRTQEKVAA